MAPEPPQPLTLTADPRLDTAVAKGWEPFAAAIAAAGSTRAARWLARRAGDADLAESAEPLFAAVGGRRPGGAGGALLALAEIAEEVEDDALADAFWEGALESAEVAGDADAIARSIGGLSALAERLGDPLAAAEYRIAFLNWRRRPGHASDPGSGRGGVRRDRRLAQRDGAQKDAAIWAYRQASYTRLLESDDERAVEGDWEADPAPYSGWA
jgi:hypothetical protein